MPPRRAWLTAFGCIWSVLAGAAMAGVFGTFGAPFGTVLGAVVAVVGAAAAFVRPQVTTSAYCGWNNLADRVIRGTSLALRAIYFYVVFVAVSFAGSSLELARPTAGVSLWTCRVGKPAQGGESADVMEVEGVGRRYVAWAVRGGRVWALGLWPLFRLLAVLEHERVERAPTGHNYTLF